MNKNESEINDITRNTPIKLNKIKCSDTWKRNCPQCNRIVYHKSEASLQLTVRKKRLCCGCASKNTHKLSTEEFVKRSNKKHNFKYDYSKSIYQGALAKIAIICPEHGEFEQIANLHANVGCGCKLCNFKRYKEKYTRTTEEFINEALVIHGKKYNYARVLYKTDTTKVIITCLMHGDFLQTPHHHLNEKGCPKCAHSISKPEIQFLDYLKIPKENRQKYIKPYRVDGIDKNTIYEFLGDYWHGNPDVFDCNKIHPLIKKTYKELHDKAISKLTTLKLAGYSVKYIWENDWNKFKRGDVDYPNVISI